MRRSLLIKLALRNPLSLVRRFKGIRPPNLSAGLKVDAVAKLPRVKPLNTMSVRPPKPTMPKMPKLKLPDPTKAPGGPVRPGKNILT